MTAPKVAERAYTVAQAAELKAVSPEFVKKCIKRTDDRHLPAKNIGSPARPAYRINASDLDAWFDRFGDA